MCKDKNYNNDTEEKISINMSSKSRPDVGVAFAAFLSNEAEKDKKYNDYWNSIYGYYGGDYDYDSWDDINYDTSSFWEGSYGNAYPSEDDDEERYNKWQYNKNGSSHKKKRRGSKKRYKSKARKTTNYGRDMVLNPKTKEWEYDYDQNYNNGIGDDDFKEIYFYDDINYQPIVFSSLYELDDYCNNMGIICLESVISYLMNNDEIHCCVDPESEKYSFEKSLLVSHTYEGLVAEVNYTKAYSAYDSYDD